MMTSQGLLRVPWTCKWGRFGGPIPPVHSAVSGFVFWHCGRPGQTETDDRLLNRGSCETCRFWEPAPQEVRPGQ